PRRDGRVGQQGGGIGRERWPQGGRARTGEPAEPGQPPGQVGRGGGPRQRGERRQDERAHRQRRGRLEDPEHEQEALRSTEVVDERDRTERRAGGGRDPRGTLEGGPVGQGRALRQDGGRAAESTQEQIEGYVGALPCRRLEDLASVV